MRCLLSAVKVLPPLRIWLTSHSLAAASSLLSALGRRTVRTTQTVRTLLAITSQCTVRSLRRKRRRCGHAPPLACHLPVCGRYASSTTMIALAFKQSSYKTMKRFSKLSTSLRFGVRRTSFDEPSLLPSPCSGKNQLVLPLKTWSLTERDRSLF